MGKKIIFAIVLFSVIYVLTYKIYHSWLNKNYRDNQVHALKQVYKLVIVSAFLSFIWGSYSISDYALFVFKLCFYALFFITSIRIGIKTFLRPEVIFLESSKQDTIEKETPSEEVIEKASWLKKQMETNLFYLNSELTLKSLADNLNIHPNILSKTINDGLDKSFSDFVNEYRVNAFINKLHSGNYNHITLLGISFECGFNSKTTFNRVFKNIKGVTPLNYKKSIKNNPV